MTDTVFVTGGTGFLGRHLIPALCRAGFAVRALVRSPAQHPWLARCPRLEIIPGDIMDGEALRRGAEGSRYTIHAAGLFRFWGDARTFDAVNVGGTQSVLQAAYAAGCERIVHVSTIYLIGKPPADRMIDERYTPQPADAYQVSKLHAERTALAWADRGAPVIVLRPGAFYGPHGQYAFNRLFFRDPMRGLIMQLNGGRYVILPVFVPDVAQAIVLACTRGRIGEIYHVCDDPIAHKDVYDIVCQEASLWYPRLTLPGWTGIAAAHLLEALSVLTRREPFYPLNLRSYVYNYWRVSGEKARQAFGFTPTPFREGVRRTIAWYRAGMPDDDESVRC
jgi:dihydroflavonol-4-reductase